MIPRKPVLNSLNDSRFEVINKNPKVLSKNQRVPSFDFAKAMHRPASVFDNVSSTGGGNYEPNHNVTMARLDVGIPNIRKLQSRGKGAYPTAAQSQPDLSCLNVEKAVDAKTTRFKPKQPSLTNFKGTTARDDLLLTTDDRLHNIHLENTREEREIELSTRSAYKN